MVIEQLPALHNILGSVSSAEKTNILKQINKMYITFRSEKLRITAQMYQNEDLSHVTTMNSGLLKFSLTA